MKYGLTFVPENGNFMGLRCGVMKDYAEPELFDNYEDAERCAEKFFGFMVGDRGTRDTYRERLLVKIEPESKVIPLIARVVEFYAGRIELKVDGNGSRQFVLKNPDKKTYAELRAWLNEERKSRQVHELERVEYMEKTRQEHAAIERQKQGIRLAVPLKKDRSQS